MKKLHKAFLSPLIALALLLSQLVAPAFAQVVTPPPAPGICGSDFSGAGTFTYTGSALAAAGYGLTGWSCTPTTNLVKVEAYGVLQNGGTANNVALQINCGTATAPSPGAAATGTLVGRQQVANGNAAFSSYDIFWSIQGTYVTTAGTAIWCDVYDSTSTASNIIVTRAAVIISGSN
jgi:hypothetical protein